MIIVLYFFAKKEGSPSSHLMTFGTPSRFHFIILVLLVINEKACKIEFNKNNQEINREIKCNTYPFL